MEHSSKYGNKIAASNIAYDLIYIFGNEGRWSSG